MLETIKLYENLRNELNFHMIASVSFPVTKYGSNNLLMKQKDENITSISSLLQHGLTGNRPASPCRQDPLSRQGWMCHGRFPQGFAHVHHCIPRYGFQDALP